MSEGNRNDPMLELFAQHMDGLPGPRVVEPGASRTRTRTLPGTTATRERRRRPIDRFGPEAELEHMQTEASKHLAELRSHAVSPRPARIRNAQRSDIGRGASVEAGLRRRMRVEERTLPEELIEALATRTAVSARNPEKILKASEPVDREGSLARPWPTEPDEAKELLNEIVNGSQVHRLEHDREADCVPRRALRAYVPSAQGNGLRYAWRLDNYSTLDELVSEVPLRKSKGYRIAYLTTGSIYPGDPLPLQRPESVFDVLWVRDDDSNFDHGFNHFPEDDLFDFVAMYKAAGRRILCLVHYYVFGASGWYVAVWIKDEKYESHEWTVLRAAADQSSLESAVDLVPNFRAIWATRSDDDVAIVMVRDVVPHPPWHLLIRTPNDPKADILAEFHDRKPDLVPLCIECKVSPHTSAVPDYLWTIVGTADPDLESEGASRWWWDVNEPELPDADEEARLKSEGQRLHAFAQVVTSAGGPRYTKVTSRVPKLRECTIDDPVDAPLDRTLLGVLDWMVSGFMGRGEVLSLSIAIQDNFGWRLRRAYTLAPWQYEDAYPGSQFRLGSCNKMITSFSLFKAMEMSSENVSVQSEVFGLSGWPDRFQPTVDPFAVSYPPQVQTVRLIHLLQHTAGWIQNEFDVGASHEVVVNAVAKAGKLSGWTAPSDVGLYPMVREDALFYMLNAEGFTNHPNEVTLLKETGYDAVDGTGDPILPGTVYAYSGFHYMLLGEAIEVLTGSHSGPREDWAGYNRWVAENMLEPLGCTGTGPGFTARLNAYPCEVTYPSQLYLEQRPQERNPFKETMLYGVPSDAPDQGVWYSDGETLPFDAFRSPQVVSESYGSESGYRREAVATSGGAVGTAPDLCRLMSAIVFPSPVLSWLSLFTIRDTNSTGVSRQTPGGLGVDSSRNLLSHSGAAPGSVCYMSLDTGSNTRMGICMNKFDQIQMPFNIMKEIHDLLSGNWP